MRITKPVIEDRLAPTEAHDRAADDHEMRPLMDKSQESEPNIEFIQDDENRWDKIFELLANETNRQ